MGIMYQINYRCPTCCKPIPPATTIGGYPLVPGVWCECGKPAVPPDTCPRCGAKVIATGSNLLACENGHVCHRDSPAESPAPDPIDHPPHYCHGEIECIDAIAAALGDGFADYLRGAILKYAWRLPHKDAAAEDAKKLAWYAARLVEVLQCQP